MSTATQPQKPDSSRYVDFDEFIDFQVQKTRAGIKANDLLTAFIGGSVAVLAYVLVFAVFDHWIINGGFSRGLRLSLLSLLVTGLTVWCVWKLVLPYFRSISALYAAKEIEEAEPAFRSTLVTLVDLKRAGRPVSPEILAVLEKRAGLGLTHMDVEQAVDRRPLMRLSYVLLGLVVVTCLYTVFSPKKLSNSLWRALLPTASVAVDTRTEIVRVDPGNAEVLAKSQLAVTADLSGEIPEEVTLLYSTADNRLVDEPIALRETEDGLRQYRGVITGENGRGILQSLTYRVVAGDATSPTYTVTVKQPPSATVDEVVYDFPDYMQFQDRTQVGGAIDAYEGTIVTVRATANMPIESAMLKFSDTEDISVKDIELPVTIESGTELSVSWQLRFRNDGTKPNFYHILCRNDAGEEDPTPTLYPIKITPDAPPEIELLHPAGNIERPANAVVPLLFEAQDDFRLRTIILHIEQNGEQLPQAPRLFEAPPERQSISGRYNWDLGELVLNPGDEIRYWLEARDNLQPFENRTLNQRKTTPLNITITEAASPEEVQQQLEDDQQQIDEQLAAERQQQNDDQSTPPPSGEDTNDETPPPPSSDEPQENEESEPQPNEAGESGEQTSGETGESGSRKQRKEGSPEGQGNQSAEPSDEAGDPESQQPGQSGQESGKEAPFEELLERLVKDEQQRQQDSPDRGDSAQDHQEQSKGERQPQGDARQPGAGESSPEKGENSPQDGTEESSESQRGESGERSSRQSESLSSESQSGSPPDQSTESGQERSPSSPRGEKASDSGTRGADDSQQTSGNPPVREGDAAGGEPTETQASPSGDTDRPESESTGSDGEQSPPGDAQSREPMSGEPRSRDPRAGEPKSGQQDNRPPGEASPNDRGSDGEPSPTEDPQSGEPADGSQSSGEQSPSERGSSKSPMPQPSDQGRTPPGDSQSSPDDRNGTKGQPQGTPQEPSESAPKGEATGEMPPDAQGGRPSDSQSPSDSRPMPSGDEGTPQEGEPGGEGESSSGEGQAKGESGKQGGGSEPSAGEQESGGSEEGGGSPAGGEEGAPSKGGGSEGETSDQGAGQAESSGHGQTSGGPGGPSTSGGGKQPASGSADSDGGGAGEGEAPSVDGPGEGGEGSGESVQGDSPDLEAKRKAANLVLKRLEDQLQRGEIDQALREELGVTDEQLQDFTQRLRQRLADTGEDDSPEARARRQQFNETLRNLKFESSGTSREGGDQPRESTGGFAGPQRKAPARRRDATEAYQREINRRKNPQ